MKLLRTIRLDPSDRLVFETAAEPGEWAVSGAFLFADVDATTLEGKRRVAYRSGMLGIDSFGWSTLVAVVEASDVEREAAVDALARQLVTRLGAPDLASARAAAAEEIAYAAELAAHPVNTLIAVERQSAVDGTVERFRTLHQRAGATSPHGRVFGFVSAETPDDAGDAAVERVDLVGLAAGKTAR